MFEYWKEVSIMVEMEKSAITKDRNIPIQVGCAVDTTGDITPLWFRYEDPEDYKLCTVKILNVLSHKEINPVGFKIIQFICTALIDESKRLFELRYSVGTHKWTFYQMLN